MTRLHLTVEARSWTDRPDPRTDRARRARLAAALGDAASRIQMGESEGAIERPDLILKFELAGPAPITSRAPLEPVAAA